jgi:peptidoglycan hydrolase CwlO-like protein
VINNNITIVEIHGNFSHKEYWELFKEKVILNSINLNIKFFDISDENLELTKKKVIEEYSRALELETHALYSPGCNDIVQTEVSVQCQEDSPQAIRSAWAKLLTQLSSKDESIKELSEKLNNLDNDIVEIDEILNKLI